MEQGPATYPQADKQDCSGAVMLHPTKVQQLDSRCETAHVSGGNLLKAQI